MKRWLPWTGAAMLLTYGVILFLRDPSAGGFPKCPFNWATGLRCPGCGAQRAIHELLHLHLAEAFGHNALLMISLPVLAGQWWLGRTWMKQRPPWARNSVVYTWAVVIVAWGIVRNVQGW